MTDSYASYQPPLGMGNAHVQSILTSSPVRRAVVRRRSRAFLDGMREEVLETPSGVKLLGYHNEPGAAPRGLVILLHGWEGSAESNYLLSAASSLFNEGYAIFRLNFRDHGDSHHLNEDLFHSCRIIEVVEAVQLIAARWQRGPVFLAGFSLGGNFALRVALRVAAFDIQLRRVVAVCPVIRPANVLDALESGLSLYERYFIDKWRRSLRHKQSLFPNRYDFADWFKMKSLREQTRHLVEHYTEFPDLETYLEGYSVAGDTLAPLTVPTTIITAVDDPVVPVSDFHSLPRPPSLEVRIEKAGGHCGFLNDWFLNSWIDDYLIDRFGVECH